MSDKEILELAANRDEKAFEELIKRTISKVKASVFNAYNRLNNEDFEDAMQNATVKAWSKIDTFRGESAFSTWFYIILKNEVLNVLKTGNKIRKHEVSMEELSQLRDSEGRQDAESIIHRTIDSAVTETAQTILEKQDDVQVYREALKNVLSKLKPSHSEIIKLVFEEGKTYQEASELLGVPIGTVMSRLYFARQNAQKLIKQYANRNDLQFNCLG